MRSRRKTEGKDMTRESIQHGSTTVNVKSNTTTAAADVGLVRLDSNANSIKETIKVLAELYTAGELDKLETRLNTLAGQCKGEDTDFCKKVTATDKAVAEKKSKAAKDAMDKMIAINPMGMME
jgi:hypothetical protein